MTPTQTGQPDIDEISERGLDWLRDTIRDFARRAEALDALIDSASPPRRLDTGRVDVSLDAGAWFAAVEVAITPRPEVPSVIAERTT